MDLSSLIGGGVRPYLEYGWVCAPNTAGQSITANTITTLTIDTEVADTGGFGSIASNQITLAAGTYYFQVSVPISFTNNTGLHIVSLFNNTTSSYVTRHSFNNSNYQTPLRDPFIGQFTVANSSVFSLLVISNGGIVGTFANSTSFTLATAGADQRTTIKLWKLA